MYSPGTPPIATMQPRPLRGGLSLFTSIAESSLATLGIWNPLSHPLKPSKLA